MRQKIELLLKLRQTNFFKITPQQMFPKYI